MIKVAVHGLIFGLGLAILIGPVFFALIQTSIKRGFWAGFSFAVGIFFSDLTCIVLSNLGVSQITTEHKYKIIIGIIGGAIMIAFGIYEFFHKYKINEAKVKDYVAPKKIIYIVKAFFLNIANPFVLIFWLTASGIVNSEYGDSYIEVIVFFSATLFVAITTDTLKAYIANKIKTYLTNTFLTLVHRIAGILLIIFGIVLIIRVL